MFGWNFGRGSNKEKGRKKAFKGFLLIDFFVFLRLTTKQQQMRKRLKNVIFHHMRASEDGWERINKLFKKSVDYEGKDKR